MADFKFVEYDDFHSHACCRNSQTLNFGWCSNNLCSGWSTRLFVVRSCKQVERAALMKRSWSDTAFEEGEAWQCWVSPWRLCECGSVGWQRPNLGAVWSLGYLGMLKLHPINKTSGSLTNKFNNLVASMPRASHTCCKRLTTKCSDQDALGHLDGRNFVLRTGYIIPAHYRH